MTQTVQTEDLDPTPERLSADDVARVRALYEAGRYLDAYRVVEPDGPAAPAGDRLAHGFTGAARTLAARLARHLGAPALARRQFRAAWAEARTEPEVRYYFAFDVLEHRGPLPAWHLMNRLGDPLGASRDVRASWFALYAHVLAAFRDFDAAERWIGEALSIGADQPWVEVERAALHRAQDRQDLGLEALDRALALRPWYRPAVQGKADALMHSGRDEEAVELLRAADAHIQCGALAVQLATILEELGQYDAATEALSRFQELSPRIEPEVTAWLASRRSDVAHLAGDREAAARHASQATDGFHVRMAARFADPTLSDRRVLLPVGFVRQHHLTCAPATLAAISGFWKMPADHLQVAEEICYNGTPYASERRWAAQRGWVAREFTVTWDAARALVDRGIPFTLTTTAPGNAHLQAVIGYDERRGTLLIREPSTRHHAEAYGEGLLEAHRASGPRGMALVPAEHAALFDGVALPEVELWERVHAIDCALIDHRRDDALAEQRALAAAAPGHRLTLEAGCRLAAYDGNLPAMVAGVDDLLKLFPGDLALELRRVSLLRDLARRDERVATLARLSEQPGIHPLVLMQHAGELVADARSHRQALKLLNRALRMMPTSPEGYRTLADILWKQRRGPEAEELYRFAACLNDKDEGAAETYFHAARQAGRADEALAYLVRRFERYGKSSGLPVRSLVVACRALERPAEAKAYLDRGLAQRPEDGDLMLYAAAQAMDQGEAARAGELIARAKGRARHTAWLRARAALASRTGDARAQLAAWRDVLESVPMEADAHAAVARLLAELEGPAAAIAYLDAAVEKAPTNVPLMRMRLERLRSDPQGRYRQALEKLLEVNPVDAWARRELALVHSDAGRREEAFRELEAARQLEPLSGSYHCVHASLLKAAGRLDEEREAYRQAILLSADIEYAVDAWITTARTDAERKEALEFVEAELLRQTTSGDGLTAFRQRAKNHLAADELLGYLRRAHEKRPDLWSAWSNLLNQLVEMNRLEEALATAADAIVRFPYQPQLWYDQAYAASRAGDRATEERALVRTIELAPDWAYAARNLASCLEKRGEVDAARATLERVLARTPTEFNTTMALARLLHRTGKPAEAIALAERAVRADPGRDGAWEALREWTAGDPAPRRALVAAQDLTRERPQEARSWLRLGEAYDRPDEAKERADALERALAINADLVAARDMLAVALVVLKRFPEAAAACRPPQGEPPTILLGRAAWVTAESGRPEAAIEEMRAVVAKAPDYPFGWRWLATWLGGAGRPAEYLAAAERMVALEPGAAGGYGHRAAARLQLKDRAGARADLEKGLELLPTYRYAAERLCAMALEDGQLDRAASALDALVKSGDTRPYVKLFRVRLDLARARDADAFAAFAEMIAAPHDDDDSIRAAVDALDRAKLVRRTTEALNRAFEAPGVHPCAAELALKRRAANGSQVPRLAELAGRGEVGRRAAAGWIAGLAQAKRGLRLRWDVFRHAAYLRSTTALWGHVAFALAEVRAYGRVVSWMSDWKTRADVQPWMLSNLVQGLRARGADAEAIEVSRAALALRADHATPAHRLWLALEEVLADRPAEAERLVAGLRREGLNAPKQFLFDVLAALLPPALAAPEARPALAPAALQTLSRAAGAYPWLASHRERRRIYDRALWWVVSRCGGAFTALHAFWLYLTARVVKR